MTEHTARCQLADVALRDAGQLAVAAYREWAQAGRDVAAAENAVALAKVPGRRRSYAQACEALFRADGELMRAWHHKTETRRAVLVARGAAALAADECGCGRH